MKVPWWLSAMLLGGGLGLVFRLGWQTLADTGGYTASVTNRIPVEMDNSAAAADILQQMTPASPAGADAAQATDAPPLPLAPTPAPTPAPPEPLRSSWHNETFEQECGGMADVIRKINTEYKDRAPVVWRCGCKESGLGDRLKGVVAAWMLAMVLGRPFACEVFPSMVELEYGVEPALMDWRSNFFDYQKNAAWAGGKSPRPVWSNRAERAMNDRAAKDYSRAVEITQTTPAKIDLLVAFIEQVMGEDGALLKTEPYVGDGKEFTSDDATTISHPFRAVIARAHYCATRALFRPTPKLVGSIDRTLAQAGELGARKGAVLPSMSDPLIIGIHIRFGGKWKDRKRAKDPDANNIIECAWNMTRHFAAAQQQAAAPRAGAVWLLASDNIERLQALVDTFAADVAGDAPWDQHGVRRWAADEGIIEHVVKSANGSDVEATRRLWLDWFLMSEVHTCALIRSSFPRTACYVSRRRENENGLVQQLVTKMDLGRYPRIIPQCTAWQLPKP